MIDRVLLFCDGYRGRRDLASRPVVSLLAALDLDEVAHHNAAAETGESLRQRHERALSWVGSAAPDTSELHLLGYSMGCHLAVILAADLVESGRADRLGSMSLIAPDPKYRPGRRDLVEAEHGTEAAFDEARELWAVAEPAGPHFVAALTRVAARCRSGCRVVYSREDEVAEWSGNVEVMVSELTDRAGVRLLDVRPGVTVRTPDTRVQLEEPEDVHEALWEAVHLD